MPFCPACQHDSPDGAKFCGFCGFRLVALKQEDLPGYGLAASLQPEPSLDAGEPSMDTAEIDPAFADTMMVKISADAPFDERVTEKLAAGRRKHPRFPLRVEVYYSSEHNFYTGLSENISSGGLFVATREPLQLGEPIEITFTVPGLDMECTAQCEVAWVQEASGTVGMGLRFTDLAAPVATAIEAFIAHREPILRDE